MAKRSHPTFGAAPRVDLLPDAQRAEIRHERTLPKLLLALVASGIVAALIWVAGSIPVVLAGQELARLEAESKVLQTEVTGLKSAQDMLQAVGSRSLDRESLTSQEVLFMELRDQILAQVPAGSTIVRFVAALPLVAEEGAAPAAEGIDCVANGATVTVTISTPGDSEGLTRAAQLIDGSRTIEGYLCATVIDSRVETVEEAPVTNTQVQLVFDELVHAGRFTEGEGQ